MKLNAIFERPVDRPIEGVIKADDDASLRNEIEEYVLTDEVAKRLESFLDAYNNYQGANGVWISGFFGSGKSHLLKMLAMLLEDRQVDGASALDLFLPKIRADDELLRAELKRAAAIPSKSILFNIDQKADIISKTQIDALLAVFVKVFDEMCGYFGKQGYIAQFERDLDSRGQYQGFKQAYEQLAGKSWERGREQALLEAGNIAKAYAQATGEDVTAAKGILDKYRTQHSVSIEDFANQINAWLQKQPPTFRLNFFVDEVGQYVADNTKLMTNLQTVAESLATKCKGRAWVIVTAQEDMNAVIGEMSKQQSNDFTKIQARFANRMKLTSADVAEVIQKRLLLKNDSGVRQLTAVHAEQANNFKTLFDFTDGSQTYKNFRDVDHFVHSYPFIPYQYELFQAAIQGISLHEGFEGRHSSVGERSMLGVFREVAIAIAKQPVGRLATFDLMFEGIRNALKTGIQSAIINAERQLSDDFAKRLLKALFLVKYVKGFKATPRNLAVLMLESFDEDIASLRKRIEAALNLLEQETFIQRSGDIYEYLTDDEKDIEKEIKDTEVETSDVMAELDKLVFDNVIKHRKIRHDNGQDYAYSRKMDDRLAGREHELAIHLITPFMDGSENETVQRMQSMGRDELRVVLPQDDRLIRDLVMHRKTEKYIKQNISVAQQDAVKRILESKSNQNRERLADLEDRVKLLVGKARLIINASDLDISSEDGQTRVMKGFHQLIEASYPNLRMLRGIAFAESDVGNYLKQSQAGLLGDSASLGEAEQELLAHIQSNARGGVRTTIKSLLERFVRKPYGWYYAAILCNLALLCARGKLEVRSDGNVLEGDALERALLNTQIHGNVVLEPQVEFTASQVRVLKDFHGDFFGPPNATEAKALARETIEQLKALQLELAELHGQAGQFPFLHTLAPVLATLKEISGNNPAWFLTELPREADKLLELKETVIDPIRKFMAGPQKAIYEQASHFVQTQEDNFSYVPGEEVAQIRAVLTDTAIYKGNRLQPIKAHLATLQQRIDHKRTEQIGEASASVDSLELRLRGMAEFTALTSAQQLQLTEPFAQIKQGLAGHKSIAMIRDLRRSFEDKRYPDLLNQLQVWSRPAAPTPAPGTPSSDDMTGPNPSYPSGPMGTLSGPVADPHLISARAIPVSFDKAWLADEAELDRYLVKLREAWLKEIQAGNHVQI